MKIKMNKSILLTGLFASAIGLVGCSSNTTDVNKSVESNKEISTDKTSSKNNENEILANYLYNSGMKFNSYNYFDEEVEGLFIDVNRDTEPESYGITLNVPVSHRNHKVFKQHLDFIMNSLGITNKESKSVYNQIEESLDEEYLKANKDAYTEEGFIYLTRELLDKEGLFVSMNITDPDKEDGLISIFFEASQEAIDKYLETSNLNFRNVYYSNNDNLLSEELFNEDNSISIRLSVPLEKIKDSEFRERIKNAINAIGGTDKDFEKTISKIDSKLKPEVENTISVTDNYKISVTLMDNAYDSDYDDYYVYVDIESC